MTAWKTATAVVRHLEAALPVYDVSEQGYSPYVRITPGVRDDAGGWAR